MLNNLKIESKISIVKPNGLTPCKIYGTLQGFYISSYAQYENAIFLFIKPFRCRRVERIVITPKETAFILNKDVKELWRKEELKKNNDITVSQLHRLTINDFKKENILYSHEYGQEIESNLNFDRFSDLTADYMMYNDISPQEAENNERYINYIKELLQEYNVNTMITNCRILGYTLLENYIKKAIKYIY